MTIQKLGSLNRSIKTLLFVLVFFCLSNFHHIKVVLDTTAFHLTVIPYLLFTDVVEVALTIWHFIKVPNRNIGQIFTLCIGLLRVSCGITGGIIVNYFMTSPAAAFGPYFMLTSLSIVFATNLGQAILHTILNRTLKDPYLAHKAKQEWFRVLAFSFLIVAVTAIFFVPIPLFIYLSCAAVTIFMAGATIYSAFDFFEPIKEKQSPKPILSQSKKVPSYFRVLDNLDMNTLTTKETISTAIENKIKSLQHGTLHNYTFELGKIDEKIKLLTSVNQVMNADISQTEQQQYLSTLPKQYPLAFQATKRNVSDTQALYELACRQI